MAIDVNLALRMSGCSVHVRACELCPDLRANTPIYSSACNEVKLSECPMPYKAPVECE